MRIRHTAPKIVNSAKYKHVKHFDSKILIMTLTDASFHGSCREAVQCVSRLGFYAVCREGQCECQNNYHYSITEERCIGDVGEY